MKKILILALMILITPLFGGCVDDHKHTWGDWKSDYEGNTHTRVCRDNFLHTETEDHDFDKGEFIKEVSDLSNGIIKYTCKDCKYSYQEVIPPTGNHNFTKELADEEHLYKDVSSATKVYYKSCADCGAFGNSEYLFEKTNLPDEYLEVEYIEANGKQQINTGYHFNMNEDSCEVVFQSTTINQNGMIFASEKGSNYFWFYHWAGSGYIDLYIANDGAQVGIFDEKSSKGRVALDTRKHIMRYGNDHSYSLDGKVIGTDNRTLNTTDCPIYLFSWGNDYYYQGRIFACKIWNKETLVRDYVPVQIKLTGEYGLYDLVSQKFFGYTNNFNYGEVVENSTLPEEFTEVEYLESNGTQYINTGVGYNNNIEYKLECGVDLSSGIPRNQVIAGFTGNMGCGIGTEYEKWWPSLYDIGDKTYYDLEYIRHGSNYSFKFDDTEYSNTDGNTYVEEYQNLLLFASWHTARSTNVNYLAECRMYYCRIFCDSILVRDMVPCIRNLDGVAGFYDNVTNEFYTFSQHFNYGNAKSSNDLPNKYQEVEYIESNGLQRIDTGVNQEAVWEFDIKFLVDGRRQLFGYGGSANEYFGVQVDGMYGLLQGLTSIKAGNRDSIIFNYEDESPYLKINDNVISLGSKIPLSYNFQIFALGMNQAFACNAKLYRAKCWQGGQLIRDYVPCVNTETKEAGLYDKVSDKFFGNVYGLSFDGGKIAGHDFDDGAIVNEVSHCQDGDIVYTCRICNMQIHEIVEKYSYKVDFSTDEGVGSIKIFKDYDPNVYENTKTAYTRNKNTFNYSKIDGIVICEIVLKEGVVIGEIITSDKGITITEYGNRYIISKISTDTKITIKTTDKQIAN